MMLPNEGEDVGWQIKRINNGVVVVTTYFSPSLTLTHELD